MPPPTDGWGHENAQGERPSWVRDAHFTKNPGNIFAAELQCTHVHV
jgi:hypothetical protein